VGSIPTASTIQANQDVLGRPFLCLKFTKTPRKPHAFVIALSYIVQHHPVLLVPYLVPCRKTALNHGTKMARLTKPLSNNEIKQAKPKEKDYNLNDGQGLSVLIRTSGTKSWVFKYKKLFSDKRTNIGFGTYPEVTLSDARTKRSEALALLAKEIDPKEQRNEINKQLTTAHNNTLKSVTQEWIQVKRSNISDDHATTIFRSLEIHIFPRLGEYPIYKIKAPIAIETLKPIEASGSLETVKRLAQRLNEVMDYAVNTGIIDHNPLTGITKAFKAPEKKHYPSIKPDELPEFMKTTREANIKYMTRSLIEWQLNTMVRPSEAAGAQWAEIDLKEKIWVIPAKRMKRKRIHKVPLSDQAIIILENMHERTGSKVHVFHSVRSKSNHLSDSTANMSIKRMGYENRLVAHGLRSLASTTLNEQGFDFDLVESALAHVDKDKVRAAYNRAEYIEKRRVMMQWWSDHIEAAKSGHTKTATVIPMISQAK